MKKSILLLLVILFLGNINIYAQVSGYTFRDSMGTYNEIVGETIAIATHTSQDPGNLNDVTYGPFALPFTFTFNCMNYTNYFVNTNGFITFGPTAPAIANYGPIESSETYEGAISAFGRNLIGVFGTTIDFSGVTNVLTDVRNFQGVVVGRHITAATGIPANTFITAFDEALGTITISNNTTDIIVNDLVVQIAAGSITRTTQGIAPNRVHIIQFKNFRHYSIINVDDNMNFQIKLYEPTVLTSGAIHIVYGNMDKLIPTNDVFGQVGLRGLTETDWNNRTNSVTLSWSPTTPGFTNAVRCELCNPPFPNSGLTFIWDGPCGLLPVELSSFVSSINRRDVTLNWTTASETNNSHFDIERSVENEQWSKVGSVNGNGTTVSPMNYSFTDRSLNTGLYHYRLKQIDYNGNFEYFNLSNEVNIGIPTQFNLSQNYPNPFNPSTTINYDLPYDGKATLKIFDISGKEVSTLINEFQTAGYYTISFNGNNLSSGIYFYSLTSNDISLTKRMLLVK